MTRKKTDPSGTPKDSHYARLRRAHREQTRPAKEPADDSVVHLYGLHTVREAILNPTRKRRRLLVTRNAMQRLDLNPAALKGLDVETVDPKAIDALVNADAVHQGVCLEAEALTPQPLSKLSDTSLLLILDQITDPHNVGAIMRSAVAFGAGALITTHRHSPTESGVLAKAASGALEHIHHITVRNLANAIEELKSIDFQTVGLDSEGPEPLETTFSGARIALVLGAEGKGLRQKTRTTVDALARLDVPGAIRSLNVSNATAIALYAAHRHLSSKA
ncbi:23S rRNA (guanosine(2251)-2'-O)-methyltransferase RlmB [Notoacmeibacter marinus]|uniref:23S rRNA (guanosine(2251)-2'-O)-methyltransferase RlmB n=1 Tax=Notoacmeibacter marinus TaxID=1876515 RepID=UPI000DF46F82|nr:23S rRNA (guanosine(2251)-2'-O)-methyltransferase RlmB [Notoacmeibacter marinus]